MKVLDQIRLVIYRYHEKGLEILLLNHEVDSQQVWSFPDLPDQTNLPGSIALDEETKKSSTIAIEADWHHIPSIRALVKSDIILAKSKVKQVLPGIEKGAYFCMKEAAKKVLPQEYKMLQELKDILVDRNTIFNI